MKSPSIFFPLLFSFGLSAFGQSLPVGMPLWEDDWRRSQIRGEVDSNVSFMARPLFNFASVSDWMRRKKGMPQNEKADSVSFAKGKTLVRPLPATFRQQYNSHHPYGWNDGSFIPANGYQMGLSAGIFLKAGPFSLQLQPEFVVAQNAAFTTFPSRHSDSVWGAYYNSVLNKIDAPERFGTGVYAKLFPGQSSLRFHFKKLSVGVATENLWWGPGMRNALLMSNNAPGFPHLTFNTTAPLLSPIGTFEGQLVSGLLKKSGYLPADTNRMLNGAKLFIPKPQGDRYFNGMVITWQPKWTKGLFLGFARAFYLYRSDVKHSLDGYLPVIGHLFKGSDNDVTSEDAKKRDQLFSFFFRLLLPKEKAELYAEYGRNDHSGDLRDLLLEPEHSRAYVIGFRKLFETTKDAAFELTAELTNLQIPSTNLVREQESWYAHHQVRDGYTHQGQVMAAGIGPGGSSQTIGLSWLKPLNKMGLLFERVVHNNDFYYYAFASRRNYWSHWVDLSVLFSKSWQCRRWLYDARLGWIKSLNYQWQPNTDVRNLHAGFVITYAF